MQKSSLERYLRLKSLPAAPTAAPVKAIEKFGDKRIVTFQDGTRKTYTKQDLVRQLNSRLQTEQASIAMRSIRKTPDGTHRVTIGGAEHGERKEFVHRGHAVNAVKRAYPKAVKTEVKGKGFYVV